MRIVFLEFDKFMDVGAEARGRLLRRPAFAQGSDLTILPL